MRLVLTYGTFDLLHIGHVRLLERASALGSGLAVGVSTDEFARAKGHEPVVPFEERCEMLMALWCVDEVFAEESWDQKAADIARLPAKVLAMGSEWVGQFDHLGGACEVVYLPRTELTSPSTLRLRTAEAAARRPLLTASELRDWEERAY